MAQSILVKDHDGKFSFLQNNQVHEVDLLGTTASDVINVSGFKTIALKFPSAWDAADVNIQASESATGDFVIVHDASGEVGITGGTNRIVVEPDIIAPLTFIRLVSSASQSASRKVLVFLGY